MEALLSEYVFSGCEIRDVYSSLEESESLCDSSVILVAEIS
jgi:hypothetical protein